MRVRTMFRGLVVATILAMLGALLPQLASAAPDKASGRYLVRARSSADYSGLRAKAVKEGARVLRDLKQVNTMVVSAPATARTSLAADRRTLGVARSQVRKLSAEVGTPNLSSPGLRGATQLKAKAPAATTAAGINPDPAWDYKGLLWDYRRIGLPQGWKTTAGSSKVTVAVADTGLDYTHSELGPRVKRVVDFTGMEDPPICESVFGISDEDLAAEFGGPVDTDWNGHGSWIGGRIAAALDGTGINGIAPKVNLVALKISEWCGSAYDETLLAAFLTAADLGIDIVNISFGGFTDVSTPEGQLIYQAYIDAVAYARSKGTIIVASAGNDHVRVGAGGRVLSHGQLSTPGDPAEDWPDPFGQVQLPGGAPGVVDVSATNRVNVPSSPSCPPGTIGDPGDPDADPPVPPNNNATCKPLSDRHHAAGQGRRNQLSYYSNYGPRIDIAGPGGARKFNLPAWDRGGTPGFPYTLDDLTNAWQVFSTTSNWAVQIPCFTFTTGSGFPQGECYSTIQGTSMAAPQVAGSLALVASAHPSLRKRPGALISRLKRMANDDPRNFTRALSATDTSPGDLSGLPCDIGYCHLEGPRIPDSEAYGAGLVNVANP
ncbi:MAG TPA: S8 family serine peptidase [Actinomycetes bacterium]|nr:S8 family serine peptidase [Actinomycetes bacterium]